MEAVSVPAEGDATGAPAAPSPKRRARLLFALKLLVTTGALAFTFLRISLGDLTAAVRRLQPSAVVVAAACVPGPVAALVVITDSSP